MITHLFKPLQCMHYIWSWQPCENVLHSDVYLQANQSDHSPLLKEGLYFQGHDKNVHIECILSIEPRL